MRFFIIAAFFVVAACESEPRYSEGGGCRLYSAASGPILQAYNNACIAAEREEMARQAGGVVTRCTETSTGMSCVTY